MNKTFYFIIFIVFSVLSSFSPLLSQETTGPRIVLEEKIFQAKEVKEGDKIEHTFAISNAGDETLQIEKVKPG